MTETWKPVVGYEGLYEISDCGNIRTLYKNPPRLLKPGTGTSGYRYVQLTKDGTYLPKQIHRLVVEAFLGEIPDEVNHKNGIKTDNRLENLEKATRSENILHRVRVLGIRPIINRGEDSGNAKFTETQIRTIRRMYKNGYSYSQVAAQFGCTKSAICHIVKRRSWSHI
jgi:hypothetical protein